jgi:hypothetical protein
MRKTSKAPAGAEENRVETTEALSPLTGLVTFPFPPTAHAVGYYLPRLRRWFCTNNFPENL